MTEDCYARRNRALALAARAHRNQIRKGTARKDLSVEDLDDIDVALQPEVPYFMHPAAVGMLLLEHGQDNDVVIAGILHDVIEDAQVNRALLEREFGPVVADLVTAASEPDKSLSWCERKLHTIDYLTDCEDMDVKLVAAADKLHNVQSIQLDLNKLGDRVWERFNATKREQAWYYHGIWKALIRKGDGHPLYDQLRQAVTEVFGPEEVENDICRGGTP